MRVLFPVKLLLFYQLQINSVNWITTYWRDTYRLPRSPTYMRRSRVPLKGLFPQYTSMRGLFSIYSSCTGRKINHTLNVFPLSLPITVKRLVEIPIPSQRLCYPGSSFLVWTAIKTNSGIFKIWACWGTCSPKFGAGGHEGNVLSGSALAWHCLLHQKPCCVLHSPWNAVQGKPEPFPQLEQIYHLLEELNTL